MIRVQQGRIKPIDVLIKQLEPSDDFNTEINEHYMVFKGLTMKEIEELQEDIKLHLDLDRATDTHVQYWESLLALCNWELAEAQKMDAIVRGELLPPEERGLHSSLEADVKLLLQGKSYEELNAWQSQIESQMHSGQAKVVEYWEAVLKRLQIFKVKACLKEIHAKRLLEYLDRLEKPSDSKDDEKAWNFKPSEEELVYVEKDDPALSSPEPVLNETKED